MITKCQFENCDKAGICKCPKDRTLKDYWHFCQKHAAEYNKNWNYYAGMSNDEIDAERDREIYGENRESKNENRFDRDEYLRALDDFLIDRKMPLRKPAIPHKTLNAFIALGLKPDASCPAVQKKYRELAKLHHPDTGGNAKKFNQITDAYQILRKHFRP